MQGGGRRFDPDRLHLRGLLTLALGSAALAVAACGSTKIDSGKVEQLIRENAGQPTPERIVCPDGVEARKGDVLRCRLFYARGREATVTVHIEDGDGHVSFQPGDLKPGS